METPFQRHHQVISCTDQPSAKEKFIDPWPPDSGSHSGPAVPQVFRVNVDEEPGLGLGIHATCSDGESLWLLIVPAG